jgi:cytochrome c-type biogenesis protein CcmH/NrfG
VLAAGVDSPRPLGRASRVVGALSAVVLTVLAVLSFVGNRATAGASDALDRADPKAAETQARRASRWQPWSGEPWRLLGEAQLEMGEVEQAQTSFRHGIDRDSGDWELWLDLALSSRGQERRNALSQAAKQNPLSPELRELRGSS